MTSALFAQAANALIPPRDEFGLPGPLWLFHILLPFTFVLHVIFMNFALGGALVLPSIWAVGRRRDRRDLVDVAMTGMGFLPIAVSFTITTGVAVLLFVQVVYGHFFYTANILLGWQWLSLLAYLCVAFYLIYASQKLMRAGRAAPALVALVVVAASLLMVAHIFSNNAVLSIRPNLWRAMHDGGSKHARDPMWTPRYLHSIVGSVSVTGLWLAVLGRCSHTLHEAARRAAVVTGLWIALIATVFQVAVGLWFFVSLDSSLQRSLLTFSFSDPRSMLWALAAVGGIVVIAVLWQSVQTPDRPRSVWLPVGLLGFVLVGMSAGREAVRIHALAQIPNALYQPSDVRLQSTPLAMFLIALVLGLGVVAMLLRWMFPRFEPSHAHSKTAP